MGPEKSLSSWIVRHSLWSDQSISVFILLCLDISHTTWVTKQNKRHKCCKGICEEEGGDRNEREVRRDGGESNQSPLYTDMQL